MIAVNTLLDMPPDNIKRLSTPTKINHVPINATLVTMKATRKSASVSHLAKPSTYSETSLPASRARYAKTPPASPLRNPKLVPLAFLPEVEYE
jgi:hypothetical protein